MSVSSPPCKHNNSQQAHTLALVARLRTTSLAFTDRHVEEASGWSLVLSTPLREPLALAMAEAEDFGGPSRALLEERGANLLVINPGKEDCRSRLCYEWLVVLCWLGTFFLCTEAKSSNRAIKTLFPGSLNVRIGLGSDEKATEVRRGYQLLLTLLLFASETCRGKTSNA